MRNRRDKRNKKETGKRKGLRPWMTAVGTVGVVGAVVGVTIGVVYLTGGFYEKVVSPKDISFAYDESLFNADYSQLEISNASGAGEFSLTITTTTSEVTERDVTLSFEGYDALPVDGNISNSIIQVPQVVRIGKPFKVTLLTEVLKDEEGNPILEDEKEVHWIKGGISNLVATCENVDVKPIELQIAVDTPVYSTVTYAEDANGNEIPAKADGHINVLSGENFSLKSKFIPAKSEYMFADDSDKLNIAEENRRKKHTFFSIDHATHPNALTATYPTKNEIQLLASNKEYENIPVEAYTFRHADDELKYNENNKGESNNKIFYEDALKAIEKKTTGAVNVPTGITIGTADITSFEINKDQISLVYGNTMKLFASYYDDYSTSPYLNASIVSNGRELDNMIKNIGIRFTYTQEGVEYDAVEDKLISLNFSATQEYNEKDYYLPNADVANIKHSYWEIMATSTLTKDTLISMEVVLFETLGETPVAYSQTHIKNLKLIEREGYSISWKDESAINITLPYEEGGFSPFTIPDLLSMVTYPDGKDPVFLVEEVVEAGATPGDMLNSVIGLDKFHDTTLTINEKTLYVLKGYSVKFETTGAFNFYFATVNSNKTVGETGYIELFCETAKPITCKEALYEDSVTKLHTTFSHPLGVEPKEPYSTYANDNKITSLYVEFEIADASLATFALAIDNDETFIVRIFDRNGKDITHYFDLHEVRLVKKDLPVEKINKYSCQYKLKTTAIIEDDYDDEYLNTAQIYSAKLQYIGVENQLEWTYIRSDSSPVVSIYNPIATTLTSASQVDETKEITAIQKLNADGVFETEATYWLKEGIEAETKPLDTFISALTNGIAIADQHGNTSSLAGQWKFVTNNPNSITISADGQSFVLKNAGENVTLEIWSADDKTRLTGADGMPISYTLTITSQGIQAIKVDKNADGDFDDDGEGTNSDTTKAEVAFDGVADMELTVANLVEFYLDAECKAESKYSKNVKYSFDIVKLNMLSLQQKIDLFSWLTVVDVDGETIIFADDGNVTGDLANIKSIGVNKHFAAEATLYFNIRANGIDTALEITINACTSIKGNNEYSIFAGSNYDGTTITNTLITPGPDGEENLLSSYNDKDYYIVSNGNGEYALSNNSDDNVGMIFTKEGKIYLQFNDFFDDTSKTFVVCFAPDTMSEDGTPSNYGLNYKITFTVSRNVKLNVTENSTYYIYNYDTEKNGHSISHFFSVGREKASDNALPTISYETTGQYLSVSGSDLLRLANTKEFKTWEENPYETITVSVSGKEIGSVKIAIAPLSDITNEVKNAFVDEINKDWQATKQIVDGVEYIVLNTLEAENIKWTYDLTLPLDSSVNILRRNATDKATTLYTVGSDGTFTPKATQAILGLGADFNVTADYLILQFKHKDGANESVEYVYMPLIITHVGDKPVEYKHAEDDDKSATTIVSQAGKENAITDYEKRYLEVALMTPDELIENSIYDVYSAGATYSLIGNALHANGLTWEIDAYTGTGATSTLINNNLIKNIDTYGNITLQNLDDNTLGDQYVALIFTLKTGATQQAFFYVMKVTPNIHLSTIYPYGGNYENLTKLNGTIELDEPFNNDTLAVGETRFNEAYKFAYIADAKNLTISLAQKGDKITLYVVKDKMYTMEYIASADIDSETSIEFAFKHNADAYTLQAGDIIYVDIKNTNISFDYSGFTNEDAFNQILIYSDEVVQVTLNNDESKPLTYKNAWGSYITFDVDNTNHTLTYDYLADEVQPLRFVVRRTYEGIINGSIDYVFALNDNAVDYSIRFKKKTSETPSYEVETVPDNFGNVTYTVDFRNGDPDVVGFDANTNKYTGLQVYLIANAITGNANSGSAVFDQLNIQLAEVIGDENDENAIKSSNANVYSSTETNDGKFTLTLPEYLKQDTSIRFVCFTTYGHSASIVFNIKANANTSLKSNAELTGGKNIAFADIYKFYSSKDIECNTYTVDIISAKSKGIDYEVDNGEIKQIIDEDKTSTILKVSSNQIMVADFVNDRKIELTFKLTFDENKTFTFSEEFILKANVKLASKAPANEDEVIAGGDDIVVESDAFFANTPTTNPIYAQISYSSPAVDSATYNSDDGKITITTKYIKQNTDATLDITFTLNSGETVQTTYSFTVAPAVQITPNYPNPTGNGALNMEYVADKSNKTMSYAGFFNQTAPFAEGNRLVINKGVLNENIVEYTGEETVETDKFKIYLKSLSNATLQYSGNDITTNTDITAKEVTFIRGENSENKEALPAIVVLTVEYKGFSLDYTIYISDSTSLYTAEGNFVTNNITEGEDEVTAETIYVDRTNAKNFFATDRMAKVDVSATASAGEYYLVFAETKTEDKGQADTTYTLTAPVGTAVTFTAENNSTTFTYNGVTKVRMATFTVVEDLEEVTVANIDGNGYKVSYINTFYASHSLFIKQSDLGNSRTIDLGISMSGKTFYGTLSVSEAEKNNIQFNRDRVIQTGENNISQAEIDKLKGMAISSATLASRVQLYYGEKINKYAVASDKFKVQNGSLTGTDLGITYLANVKIVENNAGASEFTTFTYYYIPQIDITISQEAQASGAGNFITLNANEEYPSISKLFGLKHPSTDQYLSPADGALVNLTMTVVADSSAKTDETVKTYYDKYNAYQPEEGTLENPFFKIATDSGKPYLYYADVVSKANNGTYDFRLIPQGADNDGDFVLIKLTYAIKDTSFNETYYVVVKILPDYQVAFGTGEGVLDEDGYISNKENPYVVKDVTGGVYDAFTLAGEGTQFLSIKHKGENREVSVSDFTISMKVDDGNYNNGTNLSSKIFYTNSDNLPNWTETKNSETQISTSPTRDQVYLIKNKQLTFTKVEPVLFGDQDYVVEGVDEFGFKYKLYFRLQTTGDTPSASGINITEGDAFDFGVNFQALTQDADTKEISSDTVSPTDNPNVKLIMVDGIEAYLAESPFLVSDTTSPYFGLPDINYITITKVEIDDGSDSGKPVTDQNTTLTYFATKDKYNWGAQKNTENPETYQWSDDAYKGRAVEAKWTMPKIDGNAFGLSNVAKCTMYVTLKYEKEGNTEIYTMPVALNVTRKEQINTSAPNYVTDGQVFALEDHIKPNVTGATYTYINDTLEVLVKPSVTGSFTMTAKIDGKDKSVDVSLTNTGSGAYTTKYVSLSDKFGEILTNPDVTISNVKNIEAFYYITGYATNAANSMYYYDSENQYYVTSPTSGEKTQHTFTVDSLTNDVIYIENANLLNGDNIADVEKYYIVKYDETPLNPDDDVFKYYRVSRKYQVTAQYYQLERSYPGTIAPYAGSDIEIEFKEWNKALNLKYFKIENSKVTIENTSDKQYKYLQVEVVADENSQIGKVDTITDAGTIQLTSALISGQFIKIKVYFRVSGADRSITHQDTDFDKYDLFDPGDESEINLGC